MYRYYNFDIPVFGFFAESFFPQPIERLYPTVKEERLGLGGMSSSSPRATQSKVFRLATQKGQRVKKITTYDNRVEVEYFDDLKQE